MNYFISDFIIYKKIAAKGHEKVGRNREHFSVFISSDADTGSNSFYFNDLISFVMLCCDGVSVRCVAGDSVGNPDCNHLKVKS